jgi:hypothetical protein
MIVVYGTVVNDVHVDTSSTLLGAKQYATRHKHAKVTKRIGYNSFVVAEKVFGAWVGTKLNLYGPKNT